MTESLLRWSAIAMAVAALLDPPISLSGRLRPRIAIASAVGTTAEHVRDQLAVDLRAAFDIVNGIDTNAASVIIVGDRYPGAALPPGVPVSSVTLAASASPDVRIAAIRTPKEVPPHTVIPIEVDLDATGASGFSSSLRIAVGGIDVGRASHAWHGDRERWRATLDVVPVGDPPYVVRAEVEALPTERNTDDNTAGVLVGASPHALRVLAYEPRPSWAATFVRRAIEAAGRFAVSSVAEMSRGISVRAGAPVPLADAADLDNVDAIIVGGLERLSAADVRALERFMRERGGSVALLPDGRVETGPARDLVPAPLPSERLVDAHAPLVMAAPLPRIDASETLVFRQGPAGANVLARAAGSNDAVIAIVPRGDGRLLFSGALDAWRSRAERGVEFDRFWQSAIAGLALATPPLVDVEVTPPLPAAGDHVTVSVQVRGEGHSVSATLDTGEVVRLWPAAAPGAFTGSFAAPAGRRAHAIEVVADGATRAIGRGVFVVGSGLRTVTPAAPLALAATSHGGIDVGPTDLPALARHLRDTIVPARTPVRRRPMRSPWWLIPFAGCLSGEWWLRRRRGLR
ncbi:MAG TPA: hypothetical protein VG222_04820 [Vicinamibacterales bacterium]|nr:hypothetical protein [Vicinamibacterales bacterium]